MAHTIDWNQKGVIRTFTDNLYADEILKSNFDLLENPQFKNSHYIINDFTHLIECDIRPEHTKIFASTDDIISHSTGRFKIAIVANNENHILLANNYKDEMKNTVFTCEIFQSIDEALIWAET